MMMELKIDDYAPSAPAIDVDTSINIPIATMIAEEDASKSVDASLEASKSVGASIEAFLASPMPQLVIGETARHLARFDNTIMTRSKEQKQVHDDVLTMYNQLGFKDQVRQPIPRRYGRTTCMTMFTYSLGCAMFGEEISLISCFSKQKNEMINSFDKYISILGDSTNVSKIDGDRFVFTTPGGFKNVVRIMSICDIDESIKTSSYVVFDGVPEGLEQQIFTMTKYCHVTRLTSIFGVTPSGILVAKNAKRPRSL